MASIVGRSIGGNITAAGGASGAGHSLYSITLPRSIYYAQSADWHQLTTESEPLASNPAATYYSSKCFVLQNTLWVIISSYSGSTANYGSIIRGYSLDTGEKVYDSGNLTTFSITGRVFATSSNLYNRFDIVTDGNATAYFVFNGTLYAFNAINQSVTQLKTGMTQTWNSYSEDDSDGSYYTSSNTSGITMPCICYSSYEKAVYLFGGICAANYGHYTYSSATKQAAVIYRWDVESSQMTTVPTTGWSACYGGYAYADPLTGDIYYGSASNKVIYKYSITGKTHTKIAAAPFLQNTSGDYFLVGDTMFYSYGTNLYPFNPMTGEQIEGQLPGIPQQQVTTPGEIGVGDNALYRISVGYGIEKCDLFQSPPGGAPIVAKIYKGNKYHGLTSWEAPGKLSVTTQQQTADQDIEIRMYDYPSQGGQILYIET